MKFFSAIQTKSNFIAQIYFKGMSNHVILKTICLFTSSYLKVYFTHFFIAKFFTLDDLVGIYMKIVLHFKNNKFKFKNGI